MTPVARLVTIQYLENDDASIRKNAFLVFKLKTESSLRC